jgi:hypothetical protein
MKRGPDSLLGKKAAEFYFKPIPNEKEKYQCKICPKVQRIQKVGTGYSNLMEHVRKDHPNYEEEMTKNNGKLEGIKLKPDSLLTRRIYCSTQN